MYADYSKDDITRLLRAVSGVSRAEVSDEARLDDAIENHMEHMRFRKALRRGTAFTPRAISLPANGRRHPADLH